MAKDNLYIYVLVCPISNNVRYVGISNNPSQRVKFHIKHPRAKVSGWIRLLETMGKAPLIVVIDRVPNDDKALASETKWIHHFSNLCGPELLNTINVPVTT